MKKTITTITLAFIMTLGATSTFAFDGILIADSSTTNCADTKEGIIMGDLFSELFGIIMGDKASTPCTTDTEGIIMGD